MNHIRHLGIYQVPIHFTVGLVGAGGIGAMTALVLAKMGVCQFTVWDEDTVSQENIATQLHKVSDVGKLKTEALTETLELFSDEILIGGASKRLGLGMALPYPFNLFISAVDSITARQDIWSVVMNSDVDWYLDQRMAAQQYEHWLVDMHDLAGVEGYHRLLMGLKEDDIPELNCTEKSTFFTASIASGHAGDALCKILQGTARPQRLIHFIPQQEIMKFNL